MKKTHTSLEFSKWLEKMGFIKDTYALWSFIKHKNCFVLNDENGGFGIPDGDYGAYDIMNDLCIEYHEEIFPSGNSEHEVVCGKRVFYSHDEYVYHLMVRGLKNQAEKYIMENSILNK